METKEVQTMSAKETKDVGTETNRLPVGAVIIQQKEKKKKPKSIEKKKNKSIPNATPSQEQQFRIFQNIDYPYMMRNVEIQEEDKMVKALREVLGIKDKTPEIVAEEAIQKSYGKSRSFPLYTDEELTQQELRARAINRDNDLREIASVSGLYDDDDRDAPSAFNASVDKYMSYLADFRKKNWGEESRPIEISSQGPTWVINEDDPRGIRRRARQLSSKQFNPQEVDYLTSLIDTTSKSNQLTNFNEDMELMRASYMKKLEERMIEPKARMIEPKARMMIEPKSKMMIEPKARMMIEPKARMIEPKARMIEPKIRNVLRPQDVDYIASLMDLIPFEPPYERRPIEISSQAPTFKANMKKLEKELNKQSALGKVYPRTIQDIKDEFVRQEYIKQRKKKPALLAPPEDIFAGMTINQDIFAGMDIRQNQQTFRQQLFGNSDTTPSRNVPPIVINEPVLAGERIKKPRAKWGSISRSIGPRKGSKDYRTLNLL